MKSSLIFADGSEYLIDIDSSHVTDKPIFTEDEIAVFTSLVSASHQGLITLGKATIPDEQGKELTVILVIVPEQGSEVAARLMPLAILHDPNQTTLKPLGNQQEQYEECLKRAIYHRSKIRETEAARLEFMTIPDNAPSN